MALNVKKGDIHEQRGFGERSSERRQQQEGGAGGGGMRFGVHREHPEKRGCGQPGGIRELQGGQASGTHRP